VTYNFDPDKWYENQKAALEKQQKSGKISQEALKKALKDLDKRYEEMWRRLDGTFEIPD